MQKWAVGDRVFIKRMVGGGHTGTIVRIRRLKVTLGLQKIYHVELDGTVAGHTLLRVGRVNLFRPDE